MRRLPQLPESISVLSFVFLVFGESASAAHQSKDISSAFGLKSLANRIHSTGGHFLLPELVASSRMVFPTLEDCVGIAELGQRGLLKDRGEAKQQVTVSGTAQASSSQLFCAFCTPADPAGPGCADAAGGRQCFAGGL